MVTAIVVENGASRSALERTMSAVRGAGVQNLIAIVDSPIAGSFADVKQIQNQPLNTSIAIREAISLKSDEQLIVVDARLIPSEYELASLVASLKEDNSTTITYAPLSLNGEIFDLPETSVDNLIHMISSYSCWPLMALGLNRSWLLNQELAHGRLSSILAQLLVNAITQNENVSRFPSPLRVNGAGTADELLKLSEREVTSLLEFIVRSNNIEDLFPNHAWNEHQQESAAASYHSLAALFMKLGEKNLAAECLKLSDSLEDSPRSLALRGIIALDRGEILGAVANMVSSLQQYEKRKKNDGSHYLTFLPNNVEKINTELNEGLQALNKRDNKAAFSHFAKAVFDFDSFYSEHGVDRIEDQ